MNSLQLIVGQVSDESNHIQKKAKKERKKERKKKNTSMFSAHFSLSDKVFTFIHSHALNGFETSRSSQHCDYTVNDSSR